MRSPSPAVPAVPAVLVALALGCSAREARAQAAVTFTNIVRQGSPRATERGTVLTRDEALGVRDCPCETWTFEGVINPAATARTLEWWVGTTATACATATNRFPAANATCWPLERLGFNRLLPLSGNRFSFNLPARWLVDPLAGTCTPPPNVSAGSTVHLAGLLRPPDDAVPLGTVAITVNTTRPRPVQVVTASGAEASAIVEFQHLQSEDGGTAQVPENTAGYYVLCLPRVEGYDAGLGSTSCTSTLPTEDGSSQDASDDGATGADAGATPDADSMDATSEPTSCSAAALPSSFDSNDDSQLARFACSPLLSVGTARYTVRGLANGTSYRFAVVAQDNAGNRSVPSSLTPCVTPESVTDFWEHYTNVGGGNAAAPGACSIGPRASARLPAWLALGAVLATIARAARKTKGARS